MATVCAFWILRNRIKKPLVKAALRPARRIMANSSVH
jgi:hypothetical protein